MKKLYSVCMFILVVEMCERLTYYTIAGSQRNYLMKLGSTNSEATAINSAFSILTYITPIFGGWLADAKLGRFKTIVFFAPIYCVGVALAAISSYPLINSRVMYLISVMGLVTLGSGGIKPNIANFGGDQYDISIPEEAREQESFFSYFYLVINIGAGIAYGYMVTLATTGQEPGIPKEYGFFAAYIIASASMFIAFIIFLLGSRFYVKRLPTGDSLRGLFYYLWEGAKSTVKGKIALWGWVSVILFLSTSVGAAFITNNDIKQAFAYVIFAFAASTVFCLIIGHINNEYMDHITEHPMGLLSLSEAQATLDVIPTLLVANVTFSIGYNAINGPFQSEACQMNLMVGGSQINGAFFNVADCFAIVIFVPILENLIIPYLEKRRNGRKISGVSRLIAGMVTTVFAMITAIVLEFIRRNAEVLVNEEDSNCAPPNIKMSNISGFWMFIPFALIGIAEVFVNPFLYFFTYDQTPPRARSISQAFNLLAMGALSNGFTTAITLMLSEYYTDNLNDGHLEYLYYVSAGAAIIGIPLSMFTQKMFVPKDYSEEVMGEDLHEKSAGVFVDRGAMEDGLGDKK